MVRASRSRLVLVGAAVAVVVAGLATAGTTAGASASAPAASAKGVPSSAHLPKGVRNTHATARILDEAQANGLPAGVPTSGNYAFLLRLSTRSTLDAYRRVASRGKGAASATAKTQFQHIKAAQADVVSTLPSGSRVLYKTHSVLAGVAVMTDVHNYAALRGISGVQAVYPIAPKTVSNSYAVPLQHAPQAWDAHSTLGENSTIAIIDTGIDYTHANFNGPGTTAAYNTAKATDDSGIAPTYPDPSKVVGGKDFVGDDYNPDELLDDGSPNPAFQPIPHQDPNPLDCNGHGSHVAGTAAGYGVTSGGATFTGPYTQSTPFSSLRIGPGMAPKAKLLAYKVFGCEGSTDVVGEAIDAAADPNGDGDPSDHADVINMSLGGDYSSPQDGDSVESNFASQLGITVVAASGNGGDQYDAGGSPGNAQRVLAVANSQDAYSQIDSLHVNVAGVPQDPMGAERSALYTTWGSADLVGDVYKLTDPSNLTACSTLTGNDAANVSGKIAFVEWNDAVPECASKTRADNLAAKGAVGFIFASNAETFSAGINGNALIPGVLVIKSDADMIRAALTSSQVVHVTGTSAADFVQNIPGDNDTVNSGSSRGIGSAGNVKPDVSAVGTSVFSTAMGTGDQGVSFSGTSMATPMVAGLAALVKSIHPAWSPEEVKADIMNTAGQDLFTGSGHTGTKYAPNRVGAGRIQADKALDNLVVAYVQDNPGAVSVSFGPVAVTAAMTLTKTVKVVNKSLNAASYSLAYQAVTSVPGVSYQVSPSSLTVPGWSTKTFTVKFVVTNPKSLTKTHDSTVSLAQDGLPREFLADASGRVVLTPIAGSTVALRVPVYSAPRPASTMTNPSTFTLPGSGAQRALMSMSGHGVGQGTGTAAVDSIVSGFELAATSPLAPTCSATVTSLCVHFGDERAADLKYVGVTSNAPQLTQLGGNPLNCFNTPSANYCGELYFAVSAQGPWRTAASEQEYDVLIDTNGDGKADADMYTTRLGDTDVFLAETVELVDGNFTVIDDELINDRFGDLDTALFDSDTMVMPVGLFALDELPGFSSSHSRVTYGVVTSGEAGIVDNRGVNLASLSTDHPTLNSQKLTVDALHPGVAIYGHLSLATSQVLFSDQPGTSLTVRRDVSQYNADHALGALIVHFHNKVGSKAKVVSLKTQPKVSIKLSASSITLHRSASATITVANTAGHTATGKVTLRNSSGGAIKSGSLNSGKVTFTWTPGARGTFRAYATYGGDANYASGRSATLSYRVT